MEKEMSYKSNPTIESRKRLNMAYLLLKNPEIIEIIQKTGGYFFHGTNANALPSILQYGINSVDKSVENNIEVTTGEEWSRINGKRNFVSFTDSLGVSLAYASNEPNSKKDENRLLNFGVIIGTSFKEMHDLRMCGVSSDMPEVGVIGNLPISHIRFLIVPHDKIKFVKKMIGSKDIDVVSMDIGDRFFLSSYREMLSILGKSDEKTVQPPTTAYPTYDKADVRPLVAKRKISGIKEIFRKLQEKVSGNTKETEEKTIKERD